LVRLPDDHRSARLYLLGELPAEERDRFEDRYLGDPELFACVEAAETDLLGDWAAGRLSAARAAHLEARWRESEEGRRKLAFARALQDRAAAEAETPRVRGEGSEPAFSGRRAARYALWAAAAVAAASLALLALRTLSPRAPLLPEAWAPRVASLRLSPGLARGQGDGAEIALPREARALELRLDAPATVAYRAVLETADGRPRWQADGVASTTGEGDAELKLRVPAEELPPGDYVVTLVPASPRAPAEAAAEYFFRVRERPPSD
jgi:hypothetical protein